VPSNSLICRPLTPPTLDLTLSRCKYKGNQPGIGQ